MDDTKKGWLPHIEWVIIFITLIGGFYSMDAKIDAVNARTDATNARFDQFLMVWHEEAKDFHGRLCNTEHKTPQ